MKKLYAIYHGYTQDGGYGDGIWAEDHVGTVYATEDEINAYIEKYNKPEVYEKPYDELTCHHVRAEEIVIADSLNDVKPYGEDDWGGDCIKKYKLNQEFDKKYGHHWQFGERREEIYPLYLEAMEKLSEED